MTTLLELFADLPTEEVPAGDILIAEGSMSQRLCVLVSGAVVMERGGTTFARIDSPGALFGEMSWILDKPATATARASSDVVMHVVSDPASFFRERPEAALSVLQMTAGRLDGLTQYLVDLKLEYTGSHGDTGLIDQILDSLVHHQAPRPRKGSGSDSR
jgi:CRP/FNR family transcriptional regulator, cyclic AMP receptor protein